MIDIRVALQHFPAAGFVHGGYAALLALWSICGGLFAFAAPAQAQPPERRTVVIALHPGGGVPGPGRVNVETVFERLASRPPLAIGLMGATQGAYDRRQAMLDMSAGNRVSPSGYERPEVPRYKPRLGPRGWEISRWDSIRRRALDAPTEIRPGLLASAAGGAGYVAPGSRPSFDAVLAANAAGRIDDVSTGTPESTVDRVARMLELHRMAVVLLPRGKRGDAALDALLRERAAEQLLVVIRRPPRSDSAQMLPMGIAGLPGGGRLTSRTTRQLGLVAATDLAPTVLQWLGEPVPDAVTGRLIVSRGKRDVAALEAMEARLRAVYPRRFPALFAVFGALAATAAALSIAGGRAGRRRALRVCALAVFWIPFVSLVAAALAPSRSDELALMGGGTVILALITDLLLPWPRGPLAPALFAVPAYIVDLGMGSDLIVRSLLGPNPRFGSRFYGIGNELEATLPVLLLIGLAALAGRAPKSRALAASFGLAMLALGAAIGAGRLGADVGGVITVGAGAAAAVLVLLPRRVTARAVVLALSVPVLALAALAAVDLATSGDAHFTNTVLRAEDGDALARTLARRYELAWQSLNRGIMPLITLLAIGLAFLAWRRRHTLYAPVADRPAWGAALVGGLAGSLAGALTNDSGPVLLVIGVFVLLWATAYICGDPRAVSGAPGDAEPGARVVVTEPTI